MFGAAEAAYAQAALEKAAGGTGSSAWAGCSVLAKGQQEVKARTQSSRALKSFEIQGCEEVQNNLFGWGGFWGKDAHKWLLWRL